VIDSLLLYHLSTALHWQEKIPARNVTNVHAYDLWGMGDLLMVTLTSLPYS